MVEKPRFQYWDGRSRVTRRGVLRGGAALTALGISGCASGAAVPTTAPASTSSAQNAPPAVAPTARPKYGGTLRTAGTTGRAHDDPHINASANVLSPLPAYSGLLRFKSGPDIKRGTYLPTSDFAESWEQPDELTYIFKLRRGAKFHNVPPVNGREATSADVNYSFQRILDLKAIASYLDGVSKLETPDPATFKITLAQPNADLLVNLASPSMAIVAREAVAVNGDLKNGPYIGTGPWVAVSVSSDANRDTVLARNPDYFLKGLPYADRLDFKRVPDANTLVAAFRAQQTDVLHPAAGPDVNDQVYRSNPDQLVTLPSPQYTASVELAFKADRPPFDDPRVRRAVALVMDREALIATTFGGSDCWRAA
jgi:peptide/nickel transport system substrate-binding protein